MAKARSFQNNSTRGTYGNPEKIVFLTQDELTRLLDAITNPRDKALFYTAYKHGLRASEVAMLQRADLDLERHTIRIRRLKGSHGGVYPVDTKTSQYLKRYLKTRDDDDPALFLTTHNNPVSRFTLDKLMKKYATKAKLPPEKQHFHCLKHSIATHMIEAQADIQLVQNWLGHVNIQNTLIYATLTDPTRDEQVRQVFASPKVV